MLDKITCDTPISSLISEAKVNPMLNELESIAESYEDKITSVIHAEEANGGLSGEAITATTGNGGNDAILTVAADGYLETDVKLVDAVAEVKDAVLEFLNQQRISEINRLKEKIQEKIDELSNKKVSLASTLSSLNPEKDASYYSVKHRIDMIEIDIKKYETRKSMVEGLK